MKLLSVETSYSTGSLALLDSDQLLFETQWTRESHGSHSEVATCFIEEALAKTGLRIEEVDRLVSTYGPGSFTGIRVGTNLIKSLSYSLKKKIYASDSLFALALEVGRHFASQNRSDELSQKPLSIVVNAFKNMVFFASYKFSGEQVEVISRPEVFDIDDLSSKLPKSCFIAGDGPVIYDDLITRNLDREQVFDHSFPLFPLASTLALYSLKDLKTNEKLFTWQDLCPMYLRPSSAEEKLKSGLLKPLPTIGLRSK